MIARRSIRDEYEADQKEKLLEKFKDELLGADITLTADYAAIWKELVDGKKVESFINYWRRLTHSPRRRRVKTLTCGTVLAALAIISTVISTGFASR